jgi:diguanylate cyclase (GGDEF)-like protein/PAS domain S-box-containing protein
MYCGVFFVDAKRRITYWNPEAERLTGFNRAEVMGVHCWNHVLMHVDDSGNNLCHGLCPVTETLRDGHVRETEMHLRHKNGHRLAVMVRVAPVHNGDSQITGAIQIFLPSAQVLRAPERHDRLQRAALLDPVTGIPNRHYVEIILRLRITGMQRMGWPFGVLWFEIDGLQQIREVRGTEAADNVIRTVAQTIADTSRPFDFVGRCGDDGFAAIMENPTGGQLTSVAKRYRALVHQSSTQVGDQAVQATISIGGTLAQAGDTLETLLERASKLAAQGHAEGGDRVTTDAG